MVQLSWYAEQINLDEKEKFEEIRDMLEYLASFWNPEAVKKIKEARASRESHKFATDEEFEKQLMNREFKNNALIEAIQKIRKSKDTNNQTNDEQSIINLNNRLPKDLKFLKDY